MKSGTLRVSGTALQSFERSETPPFHGLKGRRPARLLVLAALGAAGQNVLGQRIFRNIGSLPNFRKPAFVIEVGGDSCPVVRRQVSLSAVGTQAMDLIFVQNIDAISSLAADQPSGKGENRFYVDFGFERFTQRPAQTVRSPANLIEHIGVVETWKLQAFTIVDDFVGALAAAPFAGAPVIGLNRIHARRRDHHMVDVPMRRERQVMKHLAIAGREVVKFFADNFFAAQLEAQLTALGKQSGHSHKNERVGDRGNGQLRSPNRCRWSDEIPYRKKV